MFPLKFVPAFADEYAMTETNVIDGTNNRSYVVDETGRVIETFRGERYPEYDEGVQLAEIRAEFAMSWICGGGNPADVNSAWNMGLGR